MYMINTNCEICGKPRRKGSHSKCSRIKQRKYEGSESHAKKLLDDEYRAKCASIPSKAERGLRETKISQGYWTK